MNAGRNRHRKRKVAAQPSSRVGWAEAFTRMAAAKDDALAHGPLSAGTLFEITEWRWSGTRRQSDE